MSYARCPGLKFGHGARCDSRVQIVEQYGDEPRISFCCHPCFETTWDPTQHFLDGDEDYQPIDSGHSPGCRARQAERLGEPFTEGDFVLTGRVPDVPTSTL